MMTDKFQNKYRIPTTRLKNWDYGWTASYFVTICTHNMKHYFGQVTNGIMQLSELGKIAKSEWLKTFEMRPDMNLQMGEYVVMPNHFHAIITIGNNEYNRNPDTANDDTARTDTMHCVSTNKNNKYGPQSKNLSSIIRGFKSAVTKNARIIHADFAWQPRFYEHIIRNEEAYQRISQYIVNNPYKWSNDKFHTR